MFNRLGVIIASASGAMMSRSNTECLRSYFSLINMVVSNKELGVRVSTSSNSNSLLLQFLDTAGDTWSPEGVVQMRSLVVASSIHTLVSPHLDIAVLASKTLRALSHSDVPQGTMPQIVFSAAEEQNKAKHNMGAIGDPSVPILGRAAFQRRCRKIMRSMVTPNAIQVVAWAEMYDFWIKITEKYLASVKSNASPPEVGSISYLRFTPILNCYKGSKVRVAKRHLGLRRSMWRRFHGKVCLWQSDNAIPTHAPILRLGADAGEVPSRE